MLIPAIAEAEDEVDHDQDTPSSEASASMPRPRAITKVAPKSPKTAPEAPTVSAFGSSEQSAPNEPAKSEAK